MKKFAMCLTFLFAISSWIFAQNPVELGLIPYRKGDKWGYADRNKKLVIEPQFSDAGLFIENRAIVKKDTLVCVISTDGKIIAQLPLKKDDIMYEAKEGMIRVRRDQGYVSKFWFIDIKKASPVMPPLYSNLGDFSEGLAFACNDSLCGYIDKSGKVVIPFIYQDPGEARIYGGDFKEGWTWVKKKMGSSVL